MTACTHVPSISPVPPLLPCSSCVADGLEKLQSKAGGIASRANVKSCLRYHATRPGIVIFGFPLQLHMRPGAPETQQSSRLSSKCELAACLTFDDVCSKWKAVRIPGATACSFASARNPRQLPSSSLPPGYCSCNTKVGLRHTTLHPAAACYAHRSMVRKTEPRGADHSALVVKSVLPGLFA